MPFIDVNGTRLYFEERGSGSETVVLSHSLLFSLRMFDDQVRSLEDRYRCISFDFRGQGKSEVTSSGYDMETLTNDTIEVIRKTHSEPCHFVGFSMGGFVGLRLAIRHPELLKSLTLIDTSPNPEPRGNLPRYKLLNFIARWIGMKLVLGSVMPIMFGPPFLNDPDRSVLRKTWERHLLANDRRGVTRAVKGVIERSGVSEHLSDITLPTLILVGENDTATDPSISEKMHGSISGSALRVIPRAGHMSTVEEPAIVNAAINDFLGSLDSSPRKEIG